MNIEDLKILYEDNHIIVVIKPVGVPSQSDKTGDLSMLEYIKEYIKQKYNKPGNVYLGLVHRLDRVTGGIMVFAKTSKAASRLSKYIREKNFKKRYYAILNGKLNDNGLVKLENYLVKNENTNMSKVVSEKNNKGKLAILEYKVKENFVYNNKDYTLVDVDLLTGRHHQIRVQFSNIGFTLYGDMKYGRDINKSNQNLGLWAYYLSFPHPTKDEYLEFCFSPNKLEKADKIWGAINGL